MRPSEPVIIERSSGTGTGVVLGVILAIVLAMVVMWFVFGANLFGMQAAGSGSGQNTAPSTNITIPAPEVNITVPIQQPVSPAAPPAGGTKP